jgi:hypothetical protein
MIRGLAGEERRRGCSAAVPHGGHRGFCSKSYAKPRRGTRPEGIVAAEMRWGGALWARRSRH